MAFDKKKKKTTVSAREAANEVFLKLHNESCDPITELARIAMDTTNPLSLRVSILRELAQYTAAKRRAIDINPGADDGSVTIKIVKFSKDTSARVLGMMDPEVVKEEMAAGGEG